jgi:pyruvate formate lyase activating enzyme
MTELEIKGWNETSFLDWDGKVVSTLYVGGCNFRCPFCHNYRLVEAPNEFATIPQTKIKEFLISHRDFIDGICLTGGEPCLYFKNGLPEFLAEIKALGFLIKLDTNGAEPECLRQLLANKLIDYIAMDIKAPLDPVYNKMIGVEADLAKIRQSIALIVNSGIDHEFRTTVVPKWLGKAEIEAIARTVSGGRRLVLQQFVPAKSWDVAWRDLKPYSVEELHSLVGAAQVIMPRTSARGI